MLQRALGARGLLAVDAWRQKGTELTRVRAQHAPPCEQAEERVSHVGNAARLVRRHPASGTMAAGEAREPHGLVPQEEGEEAQRHERKRDGGGVDNQAAHVGAEHCSRSAGDAGSEAEQGQRFGHRPRQRCGKAAELWRGLLGRRERFEPGGHTQAAQIVEERATHWWIGSCHRPPQWEVRLRCLFWKRGGVTRRPALLPSDA